MSSLTLTLCAKNREKDDNLKERIENRKKMRKELSPLLTTLIPLVAEKDAILIVCDRLLKMVYFVATTEETLVEGLARLFRDNV